MLGTQISTRAARTITGFRSNASAALSRRRAVTSPRLPLAPGGHDQSQLALGAAQLDLRQQAGRAAGQIVGEPEAGAEAAGEGAALAVGQAAARCRASPTWDRSCSDRPASSRGWRARDGSCPAPADAARGYRPARRDSRDGRSTRCRSGGRRRCAGCARPRSRRRRPGVSQSKISDGARSKRRQSAPCSSAKAISGWRAPLGLAQPRIVEALAQAEGGEHHVCAA